MSTEVQREKHIQTAVQALAYLLAFNEVTKQPSVFDAEREAALKFLRDELPALLAPGAECTDTERDAARYRWLRNARYDNDDWYVTGRLGVSVVSPLMERELDAAIDSAMSEGKEKP